VPAASRYHVDCAEPGGGQLVAAVKPVSFARMKRIAGHVDATPL